MTFLQLIGLGIAFAAHFLHHRRSNRRFNMKLQDINNRVAILESHAAQIPDPQSQPVATEADLDVLGARLESLDAVLQSKIPTAVVAPS